MSDNSYVEVFTGKVDFPKPFQRTGKFPLDRTDLFDSYEDAVKYAKGDRNDPDSRGLCGTSYVGQTITVYENGVVTDYKITADRTLRKESIIENIPGALESGELSVDISIPSGCNVMHVNLCDRVTREQVFTDIAISEGTVTVSVAEACPNPLDIVVCCCI